MRPDLTRNLCRLNKRWRFRSMDDDAALALSGAFASDAMRDSIFSKRNRRPVRMR
jgi:hypothetical protein